MDREGGNRRQRICVCMCAAGVGEYGTQTMKRLEEQVTEY